MTIVGSKIHLKWRHHWVPGLLWWNQGCDPAYFSTAKLVVTSKACGEGPGVTLPECASPGDRVFWDPAGSLGRGLLWPWAPDAPPTSGAGSGMRHLVAQAGGHHPATGRPRRLFLAIPLPHGKANPVYLPFCWCIALPSSPSVNPSLSERPWLGPEDAGNAAAAASLWLLHQLED